jgi:TRAP transporter 4TM/12TM fusion protein
MRAAFWGVVSAVAVSFLTKTTRPNLKGMEKALLAAGSGAVQVAAACAAAGVVVGVASLTGIGLRMSELIITLSQGNLFLALLLTAMGSIVLGMGLPTTAAYVVLAALGAPALIQLGVPMLAAHLFIFYFGCISNVTPPVSLAAYAASGIAGSPPLKTAWTAMVLAFAGFLVPFMFVYGPSLLLMGSAAEIGLVVVTGVAGVTALAGSTMGYLRRELAVWERVLLFAGAIALIFPDLVSDGFGLLVLVLIFFRTTPVREP